MLIMAPELARVDDKAILATWATIVIVGIDLGHEKVLRIGIGFNYKCTNRLLLGFLGLCFLLL